MGWERWLLTCRREVLQFILFNLYFDLDSQGFGCREIYKPVATNSSAHPKPGWPCKWAKPVQGKTVRRGRE
jgi:hypothetical protein